MLLLILRFLCKAALCGLMSLNIYASEKTCIKLGGTFLGEKIDENNRIVAATGDFSGAHVKVLEKRPFTNGFILVTEHTLVNGKGGILKTSDTLSLTKVIGSDMSFMVEGAYDVVESKGNLADYRGRFISFGLMKLDLGKSILHYSGELCK